MGKKLELIQTVLDPVTGEVLHEVGEVFDDKHVAVQLAGPTAFKTVDVEDPKPEPKPEPKHTVKKDAD